MKKSNGCGAITARSLGDGSVGSANDLPPGGTRAQRQGVLYAPPIMESAAHAELRIALNGECRRRASAFDCETEVGEARVLHVPYSVTANPVSALVLCRENGLLKSKLANMSDGGQCAIYTTIVAPMLPS